MNVKSGQGRLIGLAAILAIAIAASLILWLRREKASEKQPSASPLHQVATQLQPAPEPPQALLPAQEQIEDPVATLRRQILEGPYGQMPIKEVVARMLEAEGGDLEQLYLTLALRKTEAFPVVREILLTGQPHHQRKVTKLLRYVGWAEAVPALLEVARSEEQHELARIGSLYALAAIGEKSVAPEMRTLLEKPGRRSTEKRILIALLARLGYHEGIAAMRPYLDHEDLLVRIYAVRSLAELGEHPNTDILVKATEDKDYVIREEACAALGSCGGSAASGRLTEMAKGDPISSVRQQARIGLLRIESAMMRDGERAVFLERLLSESDRTVRDWAVRSLATECGMDGRRILRKTAAGLTAQGRKSAFYLLVLPGASANFREVY